MRNDTIFSIFCFVALVLLPVPAASAVKATVQHIDVPKFKNHVRRTFDGAGINGKKKMVNFAGENMWCEAPLTRHGVNFRMGFMAHTEGYRLTAVASHPDGILVYDKLTSTILAGRGEKYKLTRLMGDVTGMTTYKGWVYLADRQAGQVYVLQLADGWARVRTAYPAPLGVTALACDGIWIYAAYGNKVGRYDELMNLQEAYDVGLKLTGLTAVNAGTLLGTTFNAKEVVLIGL